MSKKNAVDVAQELPRWVDVYEFLRDEVYPGAFDGNDERILRNILRKASKRYERTLFFERKLNETGSFH